MRDRIVDAVWIDIQEVFDNKAGYDRQMSLNVALFATGLMVEGELHDALDDARNTGRILAMLHDLHAYKTGSYDDHAHKGADLAGEILEELKLTDEAETKMICSAIYHHDDKLVTDGQMDEALKDADVIDHCLKDASKEVKEKEQARFEKLCDEFGM